MGSCVVDPTNENITTLVFAVTATTYYCVFMTASIGRVIFLATFILYTAIRSRADHLGDCYAERQIFLTEKS